jgi:predicted nucleotidyltransferase
MLSQKLDDICIDLLVTFLVEKKHFRFNEFHRFLNNKGYKISKPTLILHLRHLIDKKLVERTIVDKQNITYDFNRKTWVGLEEFVESRTKFIKHFEEERKSFDSDTPFAQVSHVYIVLILRGLFQLKYEMLKIAEPDKEFQHNLDITLYRDIWQNFVRWLLENFKTNDKKYRKEVLDIIEELIVKYRDMAFSPNKALDS